MAVSPLEQGCFLQDVARRCPHSLGVVYEQTTIEVQPGVQGEAVLSSGVLLHAFVDGSLDQHQPSAECLICGGSKVPLQPRTSDRVRQSCFSGPVHRHDEMSVQSNPARGAGVGVQSPTVTCIAGWQVVTNNRGTTL